MTDAPTSTGIRLCEPWLKHHVAQDLCSWNSSLSRSVGRFDTLSEGFPPAISDSENGTAACASSGSSPDPNPSATQSASPITFVPIDRSRIHAKYS
jgi:hypothetical protein